MAHDAVLASHASVADLDGNWAGFFDAAWYGARYPDVIAAGMDPLQHFIAHGAAERRDPNAWFESAWYAEHYPDIGTTDLNPLLHYLECGAAELRNPHPRFDAAWYVDRHPEAAANPLVYHLRIGLALGWPTEKPIAIEDYLPSKTKSPVCPAGVEIDVVIPCYRGLAETMRCIESVLADTHRPPGRIVVVDDRSPEPALSAWLGKQSAAGRIVLVRNKRNLGFVASVNRGMRAAGDRDVVLLNSDTEVPVGWLARLAAHAAADPKLASISPLSNNATICGYPGNGSALIPMGLSVSEMDSICNSVNAGRRVDLPTTVGFCMYIRRAALDDAGLFDEKTFGRGYGEENDFCIRATARGWRHALACDVFVQHAGSVSFGTDAASLSASGFDKLIALHPSYARNVARHVKLDMIGPVRFAITAELFKRSRRPTILLICHELGGGVRRHIDDLIESQRETANFLLLEATARGATLSAPAYADHSVLALPADRIGDLVRYLLSAGVGRVHIHHLAGMDMDMRDLIHRLGAPFDLTVHDYFAICPQVNLLPWPEGKYCGEPGPAQCNACIAERPSHGATDILSWRRNRAWQFQEADRVICPSSDLRDRLARYGLGGRAIVAPHEPVAAEPWPMSVPAVAKNGKLRIAVIGVLANHKGVHEVAQLAAVAAAANLEIHLIGRFEDDFPAAGRAAIQATGAYEEADLPGLIAQVRPHVVWFPAPWPETYSFTLSAAIAAGLPVVATRIGSFPERLADRPLTWLEDAASDTAAWLRVFHDVRATLVGKPKLRIPRRAATADFYADSYVQQPKGSPTVHPTGGGPTDLRREGRISIVVVPETFDNGALSPCAYIRLLQPLDHPSIGHDFDIVLTDAAGALDYCADIFVTQRYAVPDVKAADALARHAKAMGGRLLFDMDDDLLNIPIDHADAVELRPKAATVRAMLRQADAVWVSTASLASSIASVRGDARVVANGLDERLWGLQARSRTSRYGPVRILCMGTATHDRDFAIVAPALERLREEFGNRVEVDIVGVTSRGDLPSWMNRVSTSVNASRSYPGFVDWMTQQPHWDIGLAPLADTPFNLCKSSIKTFDYAALGLAVVASNVPVFHGSAASLFAENDAASWHATLSRLLRDRELRQRLGQEAHAAFLTQGTLTAQAEDRRQAWLDLLRKPVSQSRSKAPVGLKTPVRSKTSAAAPAMAERRGAVGASAKSTAKRAKL